jgi:hypothetical protein
MWTVGTPPTRCRTSAIAATIGTWPAGAVPDVERRSRKRRGAGSAVAPRPRAPRASTSARPLPATSVTAPSTSTEGPSPAMRSAAAGSDHRRRCHTRPAWSPAASQSRPQRAAGACGGCPFQPEGRRTNPAPNTACGLRPTRSGTRRGLATSTGVLFARSRGAGCRASGTRPAGGARSGWLQSGRARRRWRRRCRRRRRRRRRGCGR